MKPLLNDLISRLRGWLDRQLAALRERMSTQADLEQDGKHAMNAATASYRRYCTPKEKPGRRWAVRACVVLLCGVFLFGAVKLIGYGADYVSSRRASNELRKAYYEMPTDIPTATPEVTVTPEPQPDADNAAGIEVRQADAAPTPWILPLQAYPNNPYAVVSSRFHRLQQQNQDIIGWLTLPGVVDEAVVQRDNDYYLNRDYKGYHNINGAIFLDENTNLIKRPYTLVLYGHNMKTGAMFGSLRKVENLAFYRKHPFITFDTMYEDGRYVIFAAGTMSLDHRNWRYLNLTGLNSLNAEKRQEALATLSRSSVFSSGVTVMPEDQVLLLVTCVDNDSERRVVAARRIREDEDEESLQKQVNKSYMR